MRVVVTGAAGFIGSRLAARLDSIGHKVTAVDCYTDYYDVGMKVDVARRLVAEHPRIDFREEDLRTADARRIVGGADAVYHLAAQPGVGASWDRFDLYAEHNAVALQRVLDACTRERVHRFVFASSSSVYGDALQRPTPESSPLLPLSPYGATKMLGERLCNIYRIQHGIGCVALRYFTVYGPGQRPDMAFTRFIRAALEDAPLKVRGTGEQTRDFTFVDDAVDATIAAGTIDYPEWTYNVGGGSEASVLEAVDMIRALTGSRSEIVHEPKQAGDVRNTTADTTLAKRDLGYEPTVGLMEGLAEQVGWWEEWGRSIVS